ncbi:MAG: hypothetical protein DRQ48_03130 [Gammaproteobacteria bacterium]|nr:MAG: hypothetical protein DRQ48_03130 [Gammaproteobacteria bacterium]
MRLANKKSENQFIRDKVNKMKQEKLLDKLKIFFDSDTREREKQKSDIKDILKKLKKRERKLKEKLEAENNAGKRKHFQQEIDVVYAQRKKGIKLIKEL